ncbi:hypothetical protein H5392_01375 [Tessaracoccus sp. MC1865]|uniref:hypothetical protein n=1 Tax=Tessaracoccus sp. MC1865 TaxID=2760310 RepID=UPI001603A258|nr:hypothetical protein [Tessaracoccus sp. MC1865]MBB1482508.1 hypothetical protein [Tessaracoccus sp. MC1865]QTO38037.1 hypothetical protein J7D54_02715 [Tessaracoccus sp. MC1865]
MKPEMSLDEALKRMKCIKCGKRYRGHGDWNLVWRRGVLAGGNCPECQTPEEAFEAAFNEAIYDYESSRSLPDGRITTTLKEGLK